MAVKTPNQAIYNELLESITTPDLDLAGDTFNPSTLFDDKTQAEWFGNIIYNDESNAIRAMHAQATKIPRWVWIVVLVAGALLGFVASIWLGSFFTSPAASSAAGAAANQVLPPAPPATPYVPPR